jgi:hypothetical protein
MVTSEDQQPGLWAGQASSVRTGCLRCRKAPGTSQSCWLQLGSGGGSQEDRCEEADRKFHQRPGNQRPFRMHYASPGPEPRFRCGVSSSIPGVPPYLRCLITVYSDSPRCEAGSRIDFGKRLARETGGGVPGRITPRTFRCTRDLAVSLMLFCSGGIDSGIPPIC